MRSSSSGQNLPPINYQKLDPLIPVGDASELPPIESLVLMREIGWATKPEKKQRTQNEPSSSEPHCKTPG